MLVITESNEVINMTSPFFERVYLKNFTDRKAVAVDFMSPTGTLHTHHITKLLPQAEAEEALAKFTLALGTGLNRPIYPAFSSLNLKEDK